VLVAWFLRSFACLVLGCVCTASDAATAGTDAAARHRSAGAGAAVSFQFEQPTTILSTRDMDRYGLMFPDGPLSFVRLNRTGPEPYSVFAAGGSFGGAGTATHLLPGTYEFVGTLESLHPVRRSVGWPTSSLTIGRLQPSPEGADFDRDYTGGGPTYPLELPNNRRLFDEVCTRTSPSEVASGLTAGVLLQIYHGEIALQQPKAMPAYGGSGMAISCVAGATFEKIGQILSPHLTRDEFSGSPAARGLWADGAMIEANAEGERDCAMPACKGEREQYFYLLFTDHNSIEERYIGLSIARIRADDLLRAIRRHQAPPFRKYYDPSSSQARRGDHFTEPGIGGRSTPILFRFGEYMNTPGVVYDDYLHEFVLFYQTNQKQIALKVSRNPFFWSPATVAFRVDTASSSRVFYPTVVGGGTLIPKCPATISISIFWSAS